MAKANAERAGVGEQVEIIVGAALDTLPTLTGGPFDLVFIDADKENYVAYLEWAIKLSHPGSLIVADNVIREGRVLSPQADDHAALAVRQTIEAMGQHPRLDTAVLQTVGAKRWDGLAIALVK